MAVEADLLERWLELGQDLPDDPNEIVHLTGRDPGVAEGDLAGLSVSALAALYGCKLLISACQRGSMPATFRATKSSSRL